MIFVTGKRYPLSLKLFNGAGSAVDLPSDLKAGTTLHTWGPGQLTHLPSSSVFDVGLEGDQYVQAGWSLQNVLGNVGYLGNEDGSVVTPQGWADSLPDPIYFYAGDPGAVGDIYLAVNWHGVLVQSGPEAPSYPGGGTVNLNPPDVFNSTILSISIQVVEDDTPQSAMIGIGPGEPV